MNTKKKKKKKKMCTFFDVQRKKRKVRDYLLHLLPINRLAGSNLFNYSILAFILLLS